MVSADSEDVKYVVGTFWTTDGPVRSVICHPRCRSREQYMDSRSRMLIVIDRQLCQAVMQFGIRGRN